MKILGIAGLVFTVISFLLWLISWIFFYFIASATGYAPPLQQIMQGVSALAEATLYLAMFLISVGLVVGAKPLSLPTPESSSF